MTDIVERLRDKHCCDDTCHCDEAAAEIERLRAALDKMQRSRDRYRHAWEAEKARAALTAQPAAPKQKTEMKLNINAERFLAAVDREGDHEIGVGLFAQPAEGEK